MRQVLPFVILPSACTPLAGSGVADTELFRFDPFDRVRLDTFVHVEIVDANVPSGALTCDDNLLDQFHIQVSDAELVIDARAFSPPMIAGVDCRMEVRTGRLEAVENRSTGDIVSRAPFRPTSVRVRGTGDVDLAFAGDDGLFAEVTGSGNLRVQDSLVTRELQIRSRGSGHVEVWGIGVIDSVIADMRDSGPVTLSGVAHHLSADIRGSGDLLATRLRTETADLTLRAGGSAEVHVSEVVTGWISGSGDVILTGDPDIDVEISGSGTVQTEP